MKKRLMIIIISSLITYGCRPCSEQKISEIQSPDNKYSAALFMRNCGATTSDVYHVNVRSRSEEFSTDLYGNVKSGEVFDISNVKVNITWKDEKTLLIECAECSQSQRIRWEKSWKDVNISYQPGRR